jgi:hypothetical protein
MLKGGTSAVVVANHEKSLDALKKRKNIYFSRQKYASGVIEGLGKGNNDQYSTRISAGNCPGY